MLTRVGLALSFGKLIFVDCSFSVDGLFGVGGSLRPCPTPPRREDTNTG